MSAHDHHNASAELPDGLPSDPSLSFDPQKTRQWPENAQETQSLALRTTIRPGRWTVSAEGARPEPGEPAAANLPAFELKHVIGKGGFGEVWQALQSSLGRVIAIKRLREDRFQQSRQDPASSRQMEVTFRQEAFTTARLDHPNIVPIYDLGVDDQGRPMLAMKLVRGRPWDELLEADTDLPAHEFLDRHLPVLIDMAQAVAFAHSRGIVHRDLKPSQVMVGDYGEVLLMDWGLAVIFDLERANASDDKPIDAHLGMTLESASNPCGTVAFMAPEQTESTAANIGPWTDVFLLGGTLYYLLTLSYPHGALDVQGAFRQAMLGEVIPPARRAPNREVPEELAELCERAMASDREKRIESAQAFLQALRDFQSGASKRREAERIVDEVQKRLALGVTSYREFGECETELARAIGLWGGNRAARQLQEQTLKDHAALAVQNSDLVLARVLAERLIETSSADDLFVRIETEERRARRHRSQRRVLIRATVGLCVVLAFLAVFAYRRALVAQMERGKAELSQQLAENALGQARQKAIEAEHERDLAHDARRRAEDLMSFMLVDLREELEPLNRLDILDQVAMASLDYFETLPAESFTTNAWEQRVLSLRQIGQVLLDQGRLMEANEALGQARDLMTELVQSEPENSDFRRKFADVLGQLAHVRVVQGQLGEAMELSREARDLLERLLAQNPTDTETRRSLARRCSYETNYQLDAGNLETALNLQERALLIQRGILEENPNSPADRRLLANSYSQLAAIQERSGMLAEAISTQELGLELLEEQLADDPPTPALLDALADGYSNHAQSLRQAGRMDQALEFSARAIQAIEPLALADRANLDRQHQLATLVLQQAVLHEVTGQMTPAREQYGRAIAILSDLVPRDPENMRWRFDQARGYQFLADFLMTQRLLDEALECADRAQAIYGALADSAPENAEYRRHLGASLNAKGLILHAREDYQEAEFTLENSLDLRRQMLVQDPSNAVRRRDVAVGLTNLAAALKSQEKYDQAIQAYRESLEILGALSTDDPRNHQLRFDVIATRMNVGTILESLGDLDEALDTYSAAIAESRKLSEEDPANQTSHRLLMMVALSRAELLRQMQRREESLADFQAAAEMARGQLAQDESNLDARDSLALSLSRTAELQWPAGERQTAQENRRQALEHYRVLTQASPSEPYWMFGLLRSRLFLGYYDRELGNLDAAADSYRIGVAEALEAIAQESQASLPAAELLPSLALGLAVVEAQRGNVDLAVVAIDQAIDHGFDDAAYLEEEELLEPIRSAAASEFVRLTERIRGESEVPRSTDP